MKTEYGRQADLYFFYQNEDIDKFKDFLDKTKDDHIEAVLSENTEIDQGNLLTAALADNQTGFVIAILDRIQKIDNKETRKKIINKRDLRESTPLYEAIIANHLENVSRLLDIQEIDPTVLIMESTVCDTALHYASMYHPEMLNMILTKFPKTNIHIPNGAGLTPIWCSVLTKSFTSTKILLEKNADLVMPERIEENLLNCFLKQNYSYAEFENFTKILKDHYEKPGLEEQKKLVYTDLAKANKMGFSPLYILVPDPGHKQELELQDKLALYVETFGKYIKKKEFLMTLLAKLPLSQNAKFVKLFQEKLPHLCDEKTTLIFDYYLENSDRPFKPFEATSEVSNAWDEIFKEYGQLKTQSKKLKPEATPSFDDEEEEKKLPRRRM